MTVTLGLLLNQQNARTRQAPDPRVGVVLLERTLLDPPRAAAAKRWAAQLRRHFPQATLVPYAWHLISHAAEDGLRERSSRTLALPPHRLGDLGGVLQAAEAWSITRLCAEAMEASTVALRTPPSVTPGALGRARVQAFVEARRREGLDVVWEPEGLWEPSAAAALAQSVGATLLWPAFSGGRPVRAEDGEGLVARDTWLRVDGSGRRQSIHGGHVDELLDHAELSASTTMIFTGPRAGANLAMTAGSLDL